MKRMIRGDFILWNEVKFNRKPWSEGKKDILGTLTVLAITGLALLFAYVRLVP